MVFFAAFAVFSVAAFSARSLFPRGVSGRASATETLDVATLADGGFFEGELLTSLAPGALDLVVGSPLCLVVLVTIYVRSREIATAALLILLWQQLSALHRYSSAPICFIKSVWKPNTYHTTYSSSTALRFLFVEL